MDDWQPIGRTSNQVILYHAPSNALSVRAYRHDHISIQSIPGTPPPDSRTASTANLPVLASRNTSNGVVLGRRRSSAVVRRSSPVEIPPPAAGRCPYCYRPIPEDPPFPDPPGPSAHVSPLYADDPQDTLIRPEWTALDDPAEAGLHHVKPYFQILEQSVDGSRASTPVREEVEDGRRFAREGEASRREQGQRRSVEGYYSRFFIEEKRLGMGAEGTVYLCQHVLDGNYLGHYAIKKVAIGNSKPYLYKILQEVRLLEQLRHPNIIPYHHVWIEDAQFSSFAPSIATLHVLMSYANSGNLDTYIASRHSASPSLSLHPLDGASDDEPSPEELKRRLRERRKSRSAVGGNGGAMPKMNIPRGDARAVLLLGMEEIASLFGDIVNGLHFLHSNGILHLDLKCSNVLLHSQEGDLIPRAMISDFGTSEEMLHRKRDRTGHTGTMEYMAPETIAPDESGRWREWDTKADIWSLGLILHKLLFFKLPYGETEDYDELAARIHGYPGFKASREMRKACEKRGLPAGLLDLLEEMTDVVPAKRPSIQKVVQRSATLYTQAGNGTDEAIVPRSLVKTLNPWRKDSKETEQIQTLPLETVDSFGRLEALRARYLPTALALLKVCSLLPPFRETSPPTAALYILLILVFVDLQARDVRVSWAANACHVAGLLWLWRRARG